MSVRDQYGASPHPGRVAVTKTRHRPVKQGLDLDVVENACRPCGAKRHTADT